MSLAPNHYASLGLDMKGSQHTLCAEVQQEHGKIGKLTTSENQSAASQAHVATSWHKTEQMPASRGSGSSRLGLGNPALKSLP